MKRKIKGKNIIFAFLLCYVCYIFINQQVTMHKIKDEVDNKKMEKQKVEEKNKKLQDEVKMSKTDMYIEKLARERLGLTKQGETPVIDTKN